MKQTKATYEQLSANQRELLQTLHAKMQEAMECFTPDTKLEIFTKDMMDTYLEDGKTFLLSLAEADEPEQLMDTYLAAFRQWVDKQPTNYEQASAFFTGWMQQFSWEKSITQFTQGSKLYQASLAAVWHTTTANAKLIQGMFFVQA